MVFLLWLVSIVTFVVIQLPPGDYLSTYISRLEQAGQDLSDEEVENSAPTIWVGSCRCSLRYFKWFGQVLQGEFGFSFDWQQPVKDIIGERLALTFTIAILSAIFTFAVAIPIGIYSATHQYSLGDYVVSIIGFIGLAIPNFMLALIMLYIAWKSYELNLTGLFSPEYVSAPWSWAKLGDLLLHLPIPIIVVGTAGTAGMIRVLRGTLLDELNKQYVITARSKGVGEVKLLFKYPVRGRAQPDCQRLGLALSLPHLRRHDYRDRAGLADRWSDAVSRADYAGYILNGNAADVCDNLDRNRDDGFRHFASGGGSAHSHGARGQLIEDDDAAPFRLKPSQTS